MTCSDDSFSVPPGLSILQVLPALGDGGVEQSALEMALYLQRHGYRPLVASGGGAKVFTLQKAGIPHFLLPLKRKNPFSLVTNTIRLAKLIRRERVGLIHARSRAPAWSAWLASLLTGVPYITTFHGTYGLRGGFLKHFYNSVMLRGFVVIANSTFIKEHIVENYQIDPHRIVVASRGIDVSAFDPDQFTDTDRTDLRNLWGITKGEPVLVLVGRLTRWKGQDVFLRALGECADLDWKAVLVGRDEKGDFEAELRKLAEGLGLTDRIIFAGSRNDVPRILNATDLAFSCSTRPEAFGRAAIEAMAMQTPVIASALGGSLETIVDGKTGWLVEPAVPHSLAESIRNALHSSKRLETMGRAARKHVLEHFTSDRCCAAELEAYARTLRAAVNP